MDRINTATKAVDLFGAGKHGFRDGDLSIAQAPTDFNAAWPNGVQEELVRLVENAGLVPSGADLTQVRQAIEILIRRQAGAVAVAGGTVDAITADFTPNVTAWVDGMRMRVRMAGANLTTTPTLSPDGIAAKTIVKRNNQALAAGDIPGAGFWAEFTYDQTLDKVVLMNPPPEASLATTAAPGLVELATAAEAIAGDATRVLTGATLKDAQITQQTINTTGATSFTVGSIPATAKEITITFSAVSGTDGNNMLLQLGDSGGIETSGYTNVCGSSSAAVQTTSGFVITVQAGDSISRYGTITLTKHSGNKWVLSSNIGAGDTTYVPSLCNGDKTLSDVLTQIRLTTTAGIANFDAGSMTVSVK